MICLIKMLVLECNRLILYYRNYNFSGMLECRTRDIALRNISCDGPNNIFKHSSIQVLARLARQLWGI
jgi:hypothetical protein